MYHLFSLQDSVQLVFGRFKRVLPTDQGTINIRIIVNNIEPEHFQLHSPAVAKWIGKHYLQPIDIFFTTNKHAHILMRIDDDGNCAYEIDAEREKLLQQEQTFKQYMINAVKMAKNKAQSIHNKNKKKLLNKIAQYVHSNKKL